MSLWDLTAAIGAGLAFASFIVLCIVMFLSRHDAPNYWGEKPTLNDNDHATQHEDDLAEELLKAAQQKTKRKTKPPPRTRS